MDDVRSRASRARAELALVRLLYELRDEGVQLVVLGGLVPEILARDDRSTPAHLGTTDVDILLITHLDPQAVQRFSPGLGCRFLATPHEQSASETWQH